MMFNTEYVFKGKHANFVSKLAENKGLGIFKRNMDVYLLAPIIGKYYNRTATEDKEATNTTKIFADVIIKEQIKLEFIYRVIMLLHGNESSEEKIKRAFHDDNKEDRMKENMEIFNLYVLGGVEILYEKLLEDAVDQDDFLDNLYQLVDEFNNDFAETEDFDIYELAK
ncbi:hypothetical protein M3226_30980 [Neobacillus cucumis]|uniref:hypothetical protein n=1 Tax=Neobacillus cucumis TaxID=1740721 RepID=UPI00203F3EE1|nr:hypothetical protein [Neobacillus cucumis]MCM3729946.1 hypothetical protein [Neobacillus cucumis]